MPSSTRNSIGRSRSGRTWKNCSATPRARGSTRALGAKLKAQYNLPVSEGGFWDPQHQCYAYWRDKDGSAHGTNLVTPVNFSAIGYGLCDRPERRSAVLDRMEELMNRERLFFWPLCFSSYAKDEGHPEVNWPFPKYENGDLFLAWGELGTRAYAAYKPEVALKYIRQVLKQYRQDGLSFQRYLRRDQTGAGDDILANNCSVIVGLYRNVFGLQPRHNRLYLEPHMLPELNGTRLKYQLRGQEYQIALSAGEYSVHVDGFTIHDRQPFGISSDGGTRHYFAGSASAAALAVTPPPGEPFELSIGSWPAAPGGERSWSEAGLKAGASAPHVVFGLAPNGEYKLVCNGVLHSSLRANAAGKVMFDAAPSSARRSEVQPQLQPVNNTSHGWSRRAKGAMTRQPRQRPGNSTTPNIFMP